MTPPRPSRTSDEAATTAADHPVTDTRDGAPADESAWWRSIVAVGLVAGDLSPRAISRYGAVDEDLASAALEQASRAGVVVDGVVAPADIAALVTDLPPDRQAAIHAATAGWLMSQGPTRLLEAIGHARAAGQLMPLEELVALTEHAGRTHLSVGDYEAAHQLLEIADEFGHTDGSLARAERLCLLASALDGLGRVAEARDAAARAFDLAELAGDSRLAAEAAISYSLPADWYAGDIRAPALLQRAEALHPDSDDAIALTATRAIVEARIPVPSTDANTQLAWITRASVAQPLAEAAVQASLGTTSPVRLLSLLAWRTTHRAPQFLDKRREVSGEALDLAQRLRLPARQVEAAAMVAADALESGDRPRFDEALGVARWVAERDGNPRLDWFTSLLAAGAAHLDGDVDQAEELRMHARAVGDRIDAPGRIGADLLLYAETLGDEPTADDVRIWLMDDDAPELASPLGRASMALAHLAVGDTDAAERNLRRVLRQFDPEASYLLLATRAVRVALGLGLEATDINEELTQRLSPWAEHVAVDSFAWWCDGPASLALAELAHARGDQSETHRLLASAEQTARVMGDVRALRRVGVLRAAIGESPELPGGNVLTDREWQVLKRMARGMTNPEIAGDLCYSTSTIRNDLSTIYRKLGVGGRPEAAARAIELGLV